MKDPAQIALGSAGPAGPGFERVRAVADAVLYEGYLLYPYRRSSAKNRVRWQFGILAPRAWVEADGPVPAALAGSVESWQQQTECLLEAGPDATVHVRVRYLQLQHKSVERRTEDGYTPVESLEADGGIHLTFDEAVPREHDIVVPLADLLTGDRQFPVGAPGGEESEELDGGAGRVVRRLHPVEAVTTLSTERLDGPCALHRLRVRTENTGQSVGAGTAREEALCHTLIATHTFIGGSELEFISLTDPPQWAEDAARACRNIHTYPVLADDAGSRDLLLSSPILLPDHPQVAPESPGDLHDAAEIDEILSLRTLLLTDEEKREARATDPRAAEILDRVDGMPPEVFARLHGAIRSLRATHPSQVEPALTAPERASTPWWDEGGDDGLSPATDSALVDGVPVSKGSRVRLRPRGRGADAHDMFLIDRTARVEAVFHDVDGSVHVAVSLEDDPTAELHSWYGRFFYFRPDELQPLATDPAQERTDGRHRAVEA
ncbi:hypothetical protein AB0436_07915 [Streptomyces sp. NPDC051322]|uniref:hypothetical protein n=1 Tax=Streptomyces sp. NPDC051322 TaxID=3154645 RepID=UPI00344E73F8